MSMPKVAAAIATIILMMGTVPETAGSQPSPPEFSRPASTYTESFELELTSAEGASIHYTTDGSPPGPASPEYNSDRPLRISGAALIRARAITDDGDSSDIVTKMYNKLSSSVAGFESDLPLVIVNEHDETLLSQCSRIPPRFDTNCGRTMIHFTVIDADESGRARLLSDDLHLHGRSASNYRGNSSLTFPKRQFGVRLLDEDDENRNEPILGMPSENNWILHAPWDDKTLMRNAIAYQLYRDMGRYAPRTRFVELFKHQGVGPVTMDHYHGVYMLVERIKWDNNRVDVAKITADDNQKPEITGGYILNHDHYETHITSTERSTNFRLVRPQHENITPQQRDWIEGYIGELEVALFGDEFTDSERGYAAWMEPESFIDYHLITEGLKEIDGYRKSTYLYKDRGGRLRMGPLWDWNLSMGNGAVRNLDHSCEPDGWYYEDLLANNPAERYLNGWYTRLFEDPAFRERYRERWWELRRGSLADEYIAGLMRSYAEKLDEAQERNYDRWDIMGTEVTFNCTAFDTYREEVEYMIGWTMKRLAWVDEQLGPPVEVTAEVSALRYFWFMGSDIPNNTPLKTLEAGFSLNGTAKIRFQSALQDYPYHDQHERWRAASMERRNRPTDLNYRPNGNISRSFDSADMRGLQIRQPFRGDGGENTLIFHLPTTGITGDESGRTSEEAEEGYGDNGSSSSTVTSGVVFRFAVMDEGAANRILVDYAVRPGKGGDSDEQGSTGSTSVSGSTADANETADAADTEWTTHGLPSSAFLISDRYRLISIDFRGIPETLDNPDFRIRIRFDGEDMSANNGNRVTFNNISLETLDSSAEVTGSGRDTEPGPERGDIPHQLTLEQNYPNPFNPSTTIRYALPEAADVTLTVYTILGRRVHTLVSERREAGTHAHTFDASDLAGGAYIYELRAGDRRITRTMMLIK